MKFSDIKFGSKTNGLGDMLLLTSICKYAPMKYTIQIPEKQKRFSILFQGLANVEITENINTIPDIGGGHYAVRKLRNIYGNLADVLDNRPLVLYSDSESEIWANNFLIEKCNNKTPVILQPNCSKQWNHVRAIPSKIYENIKKELLKQNVFLIDVSEMETIDLKKYICLLRKVGVYFGSNTGDYHLAVSVGALCNIYEPHNNQFFQDYEWNYKHPSISYYKFKK